MNRTFLAAALLLSALPLAAEEYERVMLPIAPMTMTCGYHSRYDVTLVMFNTADKTSKEVTGPSVNIPAPSYLYLSKSEAASTDLMLQAESGDVERTEEGRFFTELPIVHDSDFRTGTMQFVNVRIDPSWRQSLRIYGLDGSKTADVAMRVYSRTGAVLKEEVYTLWPMANADDQGRDGAPSFSMACDLSIYPWIVGQVVRIELEPLDPATKYWAFISVANNRTQHFYTLMPR